MATPILKYSFDTWTSGTSIANEGSLGSAYNGTLNTVGSGTATIISSDKANGTQCLSLNTNNGGNAATTSGGYMSIPAFTFGGTSFTICFWYKKSSATANEKNARILNFFGNSPTDPSLIIKFSSTSNCLAYYKGDSNGTDSFTITNIISDDIWRHVTIVFDYSV